mmetsp:Transcript_4052/g.5959  ORF Transcript_4052/g.5959 Transcript_4052/m.5959 type:complete len:125 (+) Transcript_4052:124-498(+)
MTESMLRNKLRLIISWATRNSNANLILSFSGQLLASFPDRNMLTLGIGGSLLVSRTGACMLLLEHILVFSTDGTISALFFEDFGDTTLAVDFLGGTLNDGSGLGLATPGERSRFGFVDSSSIKV